MDLVVGAFVTPSLQLVRLLAEGGMGHVWVANHLALDIQVAVKFVRAQVARQDPAISDRFHREAQAAARINSPHVVQIFDHGSTVDGTEYIVMELLEGETLASRLSVAGPLDVRGALRVAEQTADVLEKAHALGIMHRDIKPENLFLTDLGQPPFVKVLDFGLAKFDVPGGKELTLTGTLLGTPAYMSPEQLRESKHATELGDLWALAVTLYKTLTGRLPFEAPTTAAVLFAVCTSDFAPLAQYRSGLPDALNAWFATALAKDPARRFRSAREFSSSFAEALGVVEAAALGPGGTGRPCLDDDEILEMVEGQLSDRQLARIELHLDGCAICQDLVAAALRDAGEGTPPQRPVGAALAAGLVVGSRYRIEHCLGSGPLGGTYDATDLLLQERVALRTLPADLAEHALRQLLSEARLVRRLQHPAVCSLHEVHLHTEHRGFFLHFVTSEFIDGETLRAALRREGPWSTAKGVPVLREILAGLGAIHAAGLLHGDLRLEKVLLQPRAGGRLQPVILGTGLRGLQGAVSSPSRYGAPERGRGESLGPRADLFAWGTLALELLGGELPEATPQPAARIPSDAELHAAAARLPAALCALIARCRAPEGAPCMHDVEQALGALDSCAPQ
jgi:serine/threonine protein kinase